MRISYLGPQGTFSEEAAIHYFQDQNIDWQMCESILDVLEAVNEEIADKGIVPIENSIEGTINTTVDGIIANNLYIVGEVILPISLHLLTFGEIELKEIKEIWSMQPALDQCKDFIKKTKAKRVQFQSTAYAAEALLQAKRTDAAALASEWAAKTFGLHIAKRNLQDNLENQTRFVVVTKKQIDTTQSLKKTMLLISPNNEYPGLLSSILNVFSALSINLTWIESRPTKQKLGSYKFFLETDAGISEERMKKAIKILETFEHHVHILGSYDTYRIISNL